MSKQWAEKVAQHPEIEELIEFALENEVSGADTVGLHLQVCATCREDVERMRQDPLLFAAADEPVTRAPRSIQIRRVGWLSAVAAALLAAVLLRPEADAPQMEQQVTDVDTVIFSDGFESGSVSYWAE